MLNLISTEAQRSGDISLIINKTFRLHWAVNGTLRVTNGKLNPFKVIRADHTTSPYYSFPIRVLISQLKIHFYATVFRSSGRSFVIGDRFYLAMTYCRQTACINTFTYEVSFHRICPFL